MIKFVTQRPTSRSLTAALLISLCLICPSFSTLVDVDRETEGMRTNLRLHLKDHSLCKVNVSIPKSHTFYTWNIETNCTLSAIGDGGLGDPITSKEELTDGRYPIKEINFKCSRGSNDIVIPITERYNFTKANETLEAVVSVDAFCDGQEQHEILKLKSIEPITDFIPAVKPTLCSTALLVCFGLMFVCYVVFIRLTF